MPRDPGYPWRDHLTLAEADECARIERLYWRGRAAYHEIERLRELRSRRLRLGLPMTQPGGEAATDRGKERA
jgi:hypothetical protein